MLRRKLITFSVGKDTVSRPRDMAQMKADRWQPERLCVDPGFGFGKRLEHNLQLLRRLRELQSLGLPVTVGLSRKSMVAALMRDARSPAPASPLAPASAPAAGERLAASVALATIAVLHGAAIVRAHDVAATVDAVRVAGAVISPP